MVASGQDRSGAVEIPAARSTRIVRRPGIEPRMKESRTNRAPGDAVSRDGDRERFRTVVLPHLADAYALARWLTGNRADAEDVVQDACLRAFRAIGGFAGGNARAWVLTIVRHTAYTWLGKNRPATLVAVEDISALEEEQARHGTMDGPTPETALMAKADATRLE